MNNYSITLRVNLKASSVTEALVFAGAWLQFWDVANQESRLEGVGCPSGSVDIRENGKLLGDE
jgi:hypothetical protein